MTRSMLSPTPYCVLRIATGDALYCFCLASCRGQCLSRATTIVSSRQTQYLWVRNHLRVSQLQILIRLVGSQKLRYSSSSPSVRQDSMTTFGRNDRYSRVLVSRQDPRGSNVCRHSLSKSSNTTNFSFLEASGSSEIDRSRPKCFDRNKLMCDISPKAGFFG